jgi:GrpB-like predicted nucleotidyltransferase (UPF0157 family)
VPDGSRPPVRQRGEAMAAQPRYGARRRTRDARAGGRGARVEAAVPARVLLPARSSARGRWRGPLTKRELAARRWTFIQNYADAKTDVVTEILRRARAGGR